MTINANSGRILLKPPVRLAVLVLAAAVALALLALNFSGARPAYAATITINFTAQVATVDDPSNVLGGAISVGDTITGTYKYDSTTSDSSDEPDVGLYYHSSPPYGLTINAGGFVFETDPNNVGFYVQIYNDFGSPPKDYYYLISLNNQGPGLVDNTYWQLEDDTAMALSSVALPAVPPTLTDWQSRLLSIPGDGYFITANITWVDPAPPVVEPTGQKFCISGPSTGVGWTWTLTPSAGPQVSGSVPTGTVPLGGTAIQIANAWVNSNPGGLIAAGVTASQFTGGEAHCFQITPGNHTLTVDACTVTGNPNGCSFNPTVIEVVAVGGIVELVAAAPDSPRSQASNSGASASPAVVLAVGVGALGAALAAGVWYVRRRRLE